MSSLEHRKIGQRKGEPGSLMDFSQHEDDSFANSSSPPYSNNKSERKNPKSSPFSANRSREESPLAHNKLTEYMTCVICFQLVTDNRECVQCHSVACVSCLNQFHSNKDKSILRPCPACNLPTADENGKPLMPISSGEEKGNHSMFVDKRTGDNEKDLIDSFLGNVSGPQQTRLSHNNLLQKMVNRMPSRCSFCQTSCTHGHLTDHYPNCPAHVTYGDYYRLGRSFDTQHVELLEMEKEIIQLRRLCETQKLTIAELELENKDVALGLQERTTQLQKAQATMRQLDHENVQFKETIDRLNMTSTQKSIAHELQDIDGLLHELHELCEVESKPTKEDRIQMMINCLHMARDLQQSISNMKLIIREKLINEDDPNVRRELLNFQEKYDVYVRRAYRDILDQHETLQRLKRLEFENLLLGVHSTQYNEQISGQIVERIKEKVKYLEHKINTPRNMMNFSELSSRDSLSTNSSPLSSETFFRQHLLVQGVT